MGLQDFVRRLVPREEHFYLFLEGQAAAAHEGALALQRFAEGSPAISVRDAVQELERRGAEVHHAMEEALATRFVTPIDREDLQRLSSELDHILDLANGAIRAAVLYGVEKPSEPMRELMGILVQCTAVLNETMPHLRDSAYPKITEGSRALRKLEQEGDRIYRESVRALFRDTDVSVQELVREKQVLEDLEDAVDHCEAVGETLAHLAVKHG